MSIIALIFALVMMIVNRTSFEPYQITVVILLVLITLTIDIGFTRLEKK